MTQAQKTAKAKFKQAIAYRQKTGVSLKEAFAHIYGKKVGAVKKKSAPKKKATKKKYTNFQLKKLANDFAYYTGGDLDKSTYRLLDKDYTDKLIPGYEKAIKEGKKREIISQKKKVAKKVAKKKYSLNKKKDKLYSAKKPGKRVSKTGKTYYESRKNRSDRGKLLGIKKYNYEQLDNIRLTRVNNDVNGNPRYVVHFYEFLNDEENSFLPFSKKYEYALKKAKKIGGRKFHNKQYGGGIVFQSYNTDNLKEQIIDLMETTPKIKY